MQGDGHAKDIDYVSGLDGREGARGQEQAGVIVEHVEDLRVPGAGERPVGDIGLPHLVGQLRFEANQRGARALLGLGDDEPFLFEDPPDRRD